MKRDGSLERFSDQKLRRCLGAVLKSSQFDPRLAGPLARAVEMHLVDAQPGTPPATDYIYRCVCAVLGQTGLQDAAQCMARRRRSRHLRRRRTAVFDATRADVAPQPWRKANLVKTLQVRFGLLREPARIVAGEVERRALGLRYRNLSTTLVRELVRMELLAWGLLEEGGLAPFAADQAGSSLIQELQPRREE